MNTTTSLAPDMNELRDLLRAPNGSGPAGSRLPGSPGREPGFLEAGILPLLEWAGKAEEWYVADRYDAEDGSFSLQVFVWPPGSATRIHDHSSWGVYGCAVGSVLEARYERLDHGSVPDHARLRKIWRLWWAPRTGPRPCCPAMRASTG
jgi:hypothetical protein